MADTRTAHDELKTARQDLAELRSDLPKIEALLQKHESAFRDAKVAGKPHEQQIDLRGKRDAVASMLEQHRADIEEQQRRVNELQRAVAEQERQARTAAGKKRALELQKQREEMFSEVEATLRELAQRWARHRADMHAAISDIGDTERRADPSVRYINAQAWPASLDPQAFEAQAFEQINRGGKATA